MSILKAVNAWQDIELFKKDLRLYPDEVLTYILGFLQNEIDFRTKINNNDFPPFLDTEKQMSRYQGIKSYMRRTNVGLGVAFQLWQRNVEKA